ncbi:MAG: hypothetical protein KF791_20825, partial [Verrucomicrobiae bacterium]|nr:hypothetical protein [Verrucomicrobiae bacterium]
QAAARRFRVLQALVKEISLADPSGKCLENLDSSDAAAREAAAAVVGPLLERAEASADQEVGAAANKGRASSAGPTGLARVEAAFSQQSKSASRPVRPKAPGPSVAKHLSGLDRAIAALREQSGQSPLPRHLAANSNE